MGQIFPFAWNNFPDKILVNTTLVPVQNYHIVAVDPANREQVNAISKLHMKLLPESMLSELGYCFLSKFYYLKLIEDKSIDAYLCVLNGEYVGFISMTNDPLAFLEKGKKKHFMLIAFITLWSILIKPSRIKTLLKIRREFAKYQPWINDLEKKYKDNLGQFLSFGVDTSNTILDYYRNNMDKIEEVNIANVLMNFVKNYFKSSAKSCFFLMTIKTNHKAIKLYKKHHGIIAYKNESNESIIMNFNI